MRLRSHTYSQSIAQDLAQRSQYVTTAAAFLSLLSPVRAAFGWMLIFFQSPKAPRKGLRFPLL